MNLSFISLSFISILLSLFALITPNGECGQSLITRQTLSTRQEIGARKTPGIRHGPGARQILATRQVFDTKQIAVQGTVRPILVSRIDPVILRLDAFRSPGIYTSKTPVVLSVETNNSPITISFRTESHDGNIHNGKTDYLPTFYAIVPSGSPPPGINEPRRRWMSGRRLTYYSEEIQDRKYGWDIYVNVKAYKSTIKEYNWKGKGKGKDKGKGKGKGKEYKVNTYMPRGKQPESGKRKYSDRVVVTAKDNNNINLNIMDFVICIEVTR